jgi:hypothetical protein
MSTKKPLIDYTSRDYSSIREDLLSHVKRYYSDIYKDFNEASFGSLMIDTVAYIGDMLSFYLDYQANESFMSTSVEYDNVLRHAKTLGYKYRNNPVSSGRCTFFIVVPADLNANRPDRDYLPTLEKGTLVASAGGSTFTLTENVNFSNPNNEVVVAAVDDNQASRAPTFFAVKATGTVVSGELAEELVIVEEFRRFLRIQVPGENVAEVVSVTDEDGNSYYEVDYLSQNTVFKEIINKTVIADGTASVIKAVAVPRRFIVEQTDDGTFLQFGYGSESEILQGSIADPSELVLKVHGKNYINTPEFDPLKLTATDKFGIAPANTNLQIIYRVNTSDNMNAAAKSITQVLNPSLYFPERPSLRDDMVSLVINSLEVENESPIVGDITLPKADEIKLRALGTFATQSRAVTMQDYKSCVYLMPSKFGAVKRCAAYRDTDDLQRNLNIYVVSEDENGNFSGTNQTIKNNLKTWLNSVRMISDSIDIYDAKILNLSIVFEAVTEGFLNKEEILKSAIEKLMEDLSNKNQEIGEPFYVTDVFKSLKDVPGILDVVDVKMGVRSGSPYSENSLVARSRISRDGRVFTIPKDYIWEIKYPLVDIKGILR